MAKTHEKHFLPSQAFRQIFGLEHRVLSNAGVESRNAGRLEFELSDAVQKCGPAMWAHCPTLDIAALEDGEELKRRKLREEIRKLEIDNDCKSGLLVPADQVEATYSRGMKALSDRLDALPVRIRVAVPDLPQSALAAISDELTALRRDLARLPADELQGES